MSNPRPVIKATIYDKKGRIISIGYNSYIKTNTYQAKLAEQTGTPDKQFLHAEVAAIIKAQRKGKPHRIFVERYNKLGEPVLAKPCPICDLAIKIAGIKIVEYTV